MIHQELAHREKISLGVWFLATEVDAAVSRLATDSRIGNTRLFYNYCRRKAVIWPINDSSFDDVKVGILPDKAGVIIVVAAVGSM